MAVIRSHLGEAVNADDARRAAAILCHSINSDIDATRATIYEAHFEGRLDQLLRTTLKIVFSMVGEQLRTEDNLAWLQSRAAVLSQLEEQVGEERRNNHEENK